MVTGTKPRTLLQIFCEFTLNSKIMFKNFVVPDDTCSKRSPGMNGLKVQVRTHMQGTSLQPGVICMYHDIQNPDEPLNRTNPIRL